MNTIEVVGKVLDLNPGINVLNFVEFKESGLIQHRIEPNIEEQKQIECALDIRAKHYFPFWDCLCSTFINNKTYSKRLLSRILHHNNNHELISISRNQYLDIEQYLDNEKKYALLSRVIHLDGTVGHLPLIDFHCESNCINIRVAEDLVEIIEAGPGYLLDSGKSFHFIGTQSMSEGEFWPYLGKLLMHSPIVDKSWIAHQLIEGSCALRVTRKKGILPKVIKEIGA